MKKLILAALAASAVLTPVAATSAEAQGRDRYADRTYHDDRGRPGDGDRRYARRPEFRHWNRGQRFDRRYAQNYSEIRDWRAYRGHRLYAPPRGYHWVRSGNDAVLVAVTGGLIGAVLAGAFD